MNKKKTLKDKLLDELLPKIEEDKFFIENGSVPTNPVEGDIWSSGGKLYGFINGKTQKL